MKVLMLICYSIATIVEKLSIKIIFMPYFINVQIVNVFSNCLISVRVCKIVTDPDEKFNIMRQMHSEPCVRTLISGHYGVNKTKAKIAERYFWAGMTQDVKEFVRKCEICQRRISDYKAKHQEKLKHCHAELLLVVKCQDELKETDDMDAESSNTSSSNTSSSDTSSSNTSSYDTSSSDTSSSDTSISDESKEEDDSSEDHDSNEEDNTKTVHTAASVRFLF